MMVTKYKKKKNIVAKSVFTTKFKPRIVKPKQGKGSFKRKKFIIQPQFAE